LAAIEVANGVQLQVPGSPIRFDDVSAQSGQRGPRLGEHTRAVLTEWLNLGADGIDRLVAEGVIACHV
jgi:crotonobetainyl-CoA:carnitine CoA-transferase CaiB-like acyl-CoA transferase